MFNIYIYIQYIYIYEPHISNVENFFSENVDYRTEVVIISMSTVDLMESEGTCFLQAAVVLCQSNQNLKRL